MASAVKDWSVLLRDNRWKRKAAEIRERDNWKCVLCMDGESELHVHHIVYHRDKAPWQYEDSLLQTLCKDCHSERHEIMTRLIHAIKISLARVPNRRLTIVAQHLIEKAMDGL